MNAGPNLALPSTYGAGSDCGRPRVQRWLLRFAALVLFTGLPGAILPGVALGKFSWLMGLKPPTLDPLTVYLSGNVGYVYTAFGLMNWAISRDVVRYRPLVILCGWIYLAGGPAYLSIDLQCPLPGWWTALDSAGCFLLGSGILWAGRPIGRGAAAGKPA